MQEKAIWTYRHTAVMSEGLRTTLRAETLARLEKHAKVRVGMTPDDIINEVLNKLEAKK